MAIVFFIEIYQAQPNFSSKIDQNDVISIYPSLNKEVAEQNNGKHKDIGYSAKIDACIDFDCSGFVVGRNATGKIDLCADCPTPQQPTPPNPAGNCAAYTALNSYLNNLPAQVTNLDKPGTSAAYAAHLSNPTNAAGARSGYWLGLTDCDSVAGEYQCGVSCKTGAVALCYPTLGAPKAFGDVYTGSDGESYQIYDPVQLHAAGVSSTTGMSFAMGTSVPNWTAGGTCSGAETKYLGEGGASNCFSTGSGPSNYNNVGGGGLPNNTYTAQTPQSTFDANNVLVTGIASGSTSIGIGNQCFYIGGAPSGGGGGSLLLGGKGNGGKSVVSLESLGGSSHANCNDCAGNISLPCESLASSQISINGAPTYSTDTGWSTGGTVWDNYNHGNDNADEYPLAFKETTCAMNDTFGESHGALGDGAKAIVPNIPCTNSSTGKRCKPGHKPGPIWVETVITPAFRCCQNVTVGKIYQTFNNNCSNCCDPTRGSNVFAGPVFSGFGCPCDGIPEDQCYCPNCANNLDCRKVGDDGYTPINSDPAGGDKTGTEISLCRQYGNEVILNVGGFGASLGPLSWAQMTVEKICNNDPESKDHSCMVTFIAWFEVSSSGEVNLPGIIGEDANGDAPTNADGTLVEPCTVGELKGKLAEFGASDVSLFINADSCHMAGGGDNPWLLYGNGDVTVGGENANPSTPDGTGGVKPADDPDSPYGNDDDGVDCG